MSINAVVVGIGNVLRGDDGIGCRAVRLLQEAGGFHPAGVKLIDAETVPENYLGVLIREKPDRVLLVDACDFGGRPGEARIFAFSELRRLELRGFSTHTLPLNMLAEVIAGATGARVWLLGVQPQTVRDTRELSPAVAGALPRVAALIRQWLGAEQP